MFRGVTVSCAPESLKSRNMLYSSRDPILESIKVAADRLSNSTNFLQFLGRHAFIMQQEEISPSPSEDNIVNERYHFMPLLLNLASTFLYMGQNLHRCTYGWQLLTEPWSCCKCLRCRHRINGCCTGFCFCLFQCVVEPIVSKTSHIQYHCSYDWKHRVCLGLWSKLSSSSSYGTLLMGRLFCGHGKLLHQSK